LYKQYLKDSSNFDDYYTNIAKEYDLENPIMYTEIVNKALGKTWQMQQKIPMGKKISKEEVKKILGLLEKEEEEEENED